MRAAEEGTRHLKALAELSDFIRSRKNGKNDEYCNRELNAIKWVLEALDEAQHKINRLQTRAEEFERRAQNAQNKTRRMIDNGVKAEVSERITTLENTLRQAREALGEIEWSNHSTWQSDRARGMLTAIDAVLSGAPVKEE